MRKLIRKLLGITDTSWTHYSINVQKGRLHVYMNGERKSFSQKSTVEFWLPSSYKNVRPYGWRV